MPGRTLSSSDVLWHSTPWSASAPPGVPGLRELADQALVFEPFLLHTRSSLPHIPLWDSAIMAGRPFLADGQSAVFSPFSVPAYVLPFWRALAEIAPGACAFVVCTTGAGSSPRALRALSLLSVSDLLQVPNEPLIRTPGLSVAYSGPDGRVYANSRALPRVFVVDRQVVVSNAESAFRATTSPAFRARRVAVSDDPIPGVRESPDLAGQATNAGDAQLVSYGDERVVVRAVARRPSILVLTDTYYPGWKATVDAKSVPVHRIDYLLRGIRLPPGSHRVEFRYQPASWRVGWILSALALVVVLVMAGVGYARARRLTQSDARLLRAGPV